jgi:hypothetical protein
MAVARLVLLLTCLGLTLSRIGLVVHEVLGHGGAAIGFGGRVVEMQLFWFGGGWVRTSTPETTALSAPAIQLAGIAAELVVGAALLLGTRRRHQRGAAKALAGLAGYLFVAHGLWYAATGIWHGFGDGAYLHHRLGSVRYPVAIVLGCALCIGAAGAARALCSAFAPALPGSSTRRVIQVVAAAVAAAGLHAALTFGELAVRDDDTYRQTMRTATQRQLDDQLARWQAAMAARGHTVMATERDAKARALRPPRPFPFALALAATALASAAAGAWSLRRADLQRSEAAQLVRSPTALTIAAGVAAVAVLAMVGLDYW